MAQDSKIVVAADSSSGTYAKMLGEIIGACSDDNFTVQPAHGVTGGAPGNLDSLVNNKAQAAFMHSDVFLANSMADPSYARFQTLVALYPEPIHVLMLRESKTKKNYVMTVNFNSLQDTAGYKVGAAGGGVFTARILQGQGQGGFEVIPFDKGDQVIAALNSGEIAAAVFVGAAPLPNIEKLNPAQYKIVPIGDAIAARVSTVYRPANISYKGMTSGPVKTLAPLATLMTRKYSTEAKVKAQAHLRACFYKALPQLKDEGSPNWQSVEESDRGVLPWYELPTMQVAAPAPAKKK
jgi:TRAP-type uncharacterized transport system substrate-binding protein